MICQLKYVFCGVCLQDDGTFIHGIAQRDFDNSLPIGRKPEKQPVKPLTTLPQTLEIPEFILVAAPETVPELTRSAKQIRFADPILKLYLITRN
jgi:hypothetical protein